MYIYLDLIKSIKLNITRCTMKFYAITVSFLSYLHYYSIDQCKSEIEKKVK